MTSKRCRIYFNLDPSDWHAQGAEGIWAERVQGTDGLSIFRILNSPFFVKGISYLDIVRAQRRKIVGEYEFAGVVEHSKHSTYMLLVPLESISFDSYWKTFEMEGCTYESTSIETSMGKLKLYSMDIPPEADICAIYAQLEQGEADGIFMFQEGHVGHPRVEVQPPHLAGC